jgi:hypothetical protein
VTERTFIGSHLVLRPAPGAFPLVTCTSSVHSEFDVLVDLAKRRTRRCWQALMSVLRRIAHAHASFRLVKKSLMLVNCSYVLTWHAPQYERG